MSRLAQKKALGLFIELTQSHTSMVGPQAATKAAGLSSAGPGVKVTCSPGCRPAADTTAGPARPGDHCYRNGSGAAPAPSSAAIMSLH